MENKTKGAGDDYPVIPLSENKTDGELLEEALIHIDKLNEELASLKEENALLKECFELSEQAKNHLRTKGYGWTGLDILKTCELVPFSDNK